MRVLLTANASYSPPRGGATRSNLVWLDHLARAGHECRIVCGAPGEGAELRHHESIVILAITDPARRVDMLRQQIRDFQPDWVLVSSEDLGHALLREAHDRAEGRVVYLAHTPQFFPFGPASWNPEPESAAIVRAARAVVAIGQHTQEYIREHLGREATVIHPPIYGSAPFPRFGSFDGGWNLMINPCVVKGVGIFLELARAFPELPFAALKGWGTTGEDLRALAKAPNVTVLETVARIDDVLSRTRVLLMP